MFNTLDDEIDRNPKKPFCQYQEPLGLIVDEEKTSVKKSKTSQDVQHQLDMKLATRLAENVICMIELVYMRLSDVNKEKKAELSNISVSQEMIKCSVKKFHVLRNTQLNQLNNYNSDTKYFMLKFLLYVEEMRCMYHDLPKYVVDEIKESYIALIKKLNK